MSGEYNALAEAERLHTQARALVERGHKLIAEGHRVLAESLNAEDAFTRHRDTRAHTLVAEGHEALAEAAALDQRVGELRSKTFTALAPTMDKAADGIERTSTAAPRSPGVPVGSSGGSTGGSRPPPRGLPS